MSEQTTFNMHGGHNGKHADAPAATRVLQLLADYDRLSAQAKIELVELYRGLTPVEVAFLHSDPAVTPNLERFRSESRKQLKTPFRDYAVLVGIAVAAVLIFTWAFAFAWP